MGAGGEGPRVDQKAPEARSPSQAVQGPSLGPSAMCWTPRPGAITPRGLWTTSGHIYRAPAIGGEDLLLSPQLPACPHSTERSGSSVCSAQGRGLVGNTLGVKGLLPEGL